MSLKKGKVSACGRRSIFLRLGMKAVSLWDVNFIFNERRDFCEKKLNGRSSVYLGPVHACGMLTKE